MSYSMIHSEISCCSSVQIIRQYYLSIKRYADEIDSRFFYRLTLHFKSLFSFKLELNYADFRGQGPSSLVSEGHTSCTQLRRMCSRRESAYTGRSYSKFLRPLWRWTFIPRFKGICWIHMRLRIICSPFFCVKKKPSYVFPVYVCA